MQYISTEGGVGGSIVTQGGVKGTITTRGGVGGGCNSKLFWLMELLLDRKKLL